MTFPVVQKVTVLLVCNCNLVAFAFRGRPQSLARLVKARKMLPERHLDHLLQRQLQADMFIIRIQKSGPSPLTSAPLALLISTYSPHSPVKLIHPFPFPLQLQNQGPP